MTSTQRHTLALLATFTLTLALSTACEPPDDCDEENPCAEGEVCGEDGTCAVADNSSTDDDDENADPCANSSAPECADPNNADTPPEYRFVLVEDLSTDNTHGATPGADVDAIGLELSDGTLVWAESVEEFEVGGDNNEHLDTGELVGPPDAAACTETGAALEGFTSLGGVDVGAYVVVGFGTQTFTEGDSVVVWELGVTNCGDAQPDWLDDETSISISTSADLTTFVEIGSVGTGFNAIIVPAAE